MFINLKVKSCGLLDFGTSHCDKGKKKYYITIMNRDVLAKYMYSIGHK